MYMHFSRLFFSIESVFNSTKSFVVCIQNVLNKICSISVLYRNMKFFITLTIHISWTFKIDFTQFIRFSCIFYINVPLLFWILWLLSVSSLQWLNLVAWETHDVHVQAQKLMLRMVMELAGDLRQSALHTVDSASFPNSTPLLYPLLYTHTYTHRIPCPWGWRVRNGPIT